MFTKEKRKDLLKWLGMAAGSVVLFLPWLPSMIRQVTGVSGSYWISEITKKVLREYLDWFFETDLPYAPVMIQTVCLIAFVLFVAAIIQNRKAGDEEKAIQLAQQKLEQCKREGKTKPSEMCPCTTVYKLVGEIRGKIRKKYK